MVRQAPHDGVADEPRASEQEALAPDEAETRRRYRRALADVDELHRSLKTGSSPNPPPGPPPNAATEQPLHARVPPPPPPEPWLQRVSQPAARYAAVVTPPVEIAAPSRSRRAIRLLSVGLLAGVGLAAAVWWTGAPGGRSPGEAEQRAGELRGTDTVLRQVEPADRPEQPQAGAETTTVRSRRHVNPTGAYSFLYPAEWRLESSGEMTKAWSPGGDLVTSFALGPPRLSSSYRSFISLLADSYDDVLVHDVKSSTISGREAISVRGRGRDATGRRITFRALLIARDDDRSVGAFAAAVGGRFDPRLNEILSSVRV